VRKHFCPALKIFVRGRGRGRRGRKRSGGRGGQVQDGTTVRAYQMDGLEQGR